MTEEEKGFIVKDHRAFADDGSTREPDKEEPEPAAQKEAGPQKQEEQAQDGPAEQSQEKESKRSLPPVDFSGLILSLSHAALLHKAFVDNEPFFESNYLHLLIIR